MNLEKILNDHKEWLKSNGQKGIRADLSGLNLSNSDLSGVDLSDATLINANLSNSDLSRVVLRRADLTRADLRGSDLSNAVLCDAVLCDAVLTDSNLSGADLSRADLWDCSGNGLEIKAIFCSEEHPVTYTSTHLQIGCERHPINDWWGFDSSVIAGMGGKEALKAWPEWKEILKMIIEKSPAKKTGRE